MSFKTVRANAAIIRSVGLGAQQCAECGQVYKDTELPEACVNGECPTNRNSGHPSEYLSQGYQEGYKEGYNVALKEVIASNAAAPKRYHLTEEQGKEVSTLLLRMALECRRVLADRAIAAAKLFE